MKKYLLIFATIFSGSALMAQTPHFGLKAGVNIASLHGEESNTDSKVGFHAGGLAHIHLNRQWAIQPELLFSTQGGEQTILGTKQKYNLNYIDVPVLLQFMFDNGFRLQAGPQVGFLMSAKTKIGGSETDTKDSYKTVDFSLPIGLGYLTSTGFGLDARWVPGLSDISEGSGNVKNHLFQLGAFYQFGGSHHKK